MNKRFSVVVAEDELEIGRALSEIINSHPHFNVVLNASDGCEVLRWLSNNSTPDVLITDIRMPAMDGLTLLKHIQDQHLKMLTVIISGYNSFDYARQAIKYGVVDYLVKPILPQDCTALLDALSQTLSNEKGHHFDLNVALNHHSTYLPPHNHNLFMIGACLGNFPFAPSVLQPEENQLCLLISQAIPASGVLPAFGIRNGIYYTLFEAVDSNEALNIFNKCTKLVSQCQNKWLSATLVLSKPIESNSLYAVANALLCKIRDSALFGDLVSIDLNRPQTQRVIENPFGMLFVLGDRLTLSIRCRDYTAFKNLLREKFDQWFKRRQPVNTLLEYVKFQYAYTAQQIIASAVPDDAPIPFDWENRLNEIFTLSSDWNGLCTDVFCLFADLFNAFQTAKVPRHFMQEVTEYIESNYTEHITNQSLAKHFGFVPSYISRIFKNYKGVSPCDYLTQVRIQNAQRMIRESRDVNFQEIALSLGFSDSSYFSKLFKKQVGLTPSEYRLQVMQNNE